MPKGKGRLGKRPFFRVLEKKIAKIFFEKIFLAI